MLKTKLKAANILRILDLTSGQLDPLSFTYFKTVAQATYVDASGTNREHIYNVFSLFDDLQGDTNTDQELLSELECIIGLLNKKNCSYLRIISH